MKQSFGQKRAGGRFLALALALIMLCSVLVPVYAEAVDEQGAVENQNEPVLAGVTYIFHVGETEYQKVKVLSGSVLTKPADPEAPEGRTFKGWFLADGQEFTSFDKEVSTSKDETVALYAHFEAAQPAAEQQEEQKSEQQPDTPAPTPEEPKQPETEGGEESKDEQGSDTENNENQNNENQNENTGDTTTGGEATTPSEPTTPTEPVAPIEPIVPAEGENTEGENLEGEQQTIYTTDAQTVEELYDRLLAATSLEEMNSLIDNLTEAQKELLDQFDETKNAALTAKMDELGAYDFVTLADTYKATVKQAGSTKVVLYTANYTSTPAPQSISFQPAVSGISMTGYKSSDDRGLTISATNGVKTGTYTLTVTYKKTQYSSTTTAVIELTVTGEEAQVFYLTSPSYSADTNVTNMWGDLSGTYGYGKVDTAGATWKKGDKGDSENTFNVKDYVKGMPTGMEDQGDGSWLMPKEKFSAAYSIIFKQYQSELQKQYGSNITLQESDITAIYLTPYKISRNNGDTPDKHIDCKVDVKLENFYTARFYVIRPDENGKENMVEAQFHRKDESVTKTNAAPTTSTGRYPEELVIGGVTYVFDGWYKNDNTFQAENKLADSAWDYKPTSEDLAKGTVEFFAHYVPKTTGVTVSKLATGKLGSTDKEFTFTYKVFDKEEKEITTGIYPEGSTAEKQEFTLKGDGTETVTISNLPVGGKITFTEETYEGYTLYYQLGVDASGYDASQRNPANGRSYTYTIESSDEGNKILFINDKNPIPDTGILLDSWPYLIALAFVMAGAILTFAQRRRRDVD